MYTILQYFYLLLLFFHGLDKRSDKRSVIYGFHSPFVSRNHFGKDLFYVLCDKTDVFVWRDFFVFPIKRDALESGYFFKCLRKRGDLFFESLVGACCKPPLVDLVFPFYNKSVAWIIGVSDCYSYPFSPSRVIFAKNSSISSIMPIKNHSSGF